MRTIVIDVARPEDTEDVVRLFGALHDYNAALDSRFALVDDWERLLREYLRQCDGSEESTWLLARHEGRTIGFVLVEVHLEAPIYRHRRWAEIVGLYVEPAFRSAGVSRRLMEHAYRWAIEHGLPVMQLYVTASNHTARRFYAKQGFATSQVIMRRTLMDGAVPDDQPHAHEIDRLHFSEGGARPIDMHELSHTHPGAGNGHGST